MKTVSAWTGHSALVGSNAAITAVISESEIHPIPLHMSGINSGTLACVFCLHGLLCLNKLAGSRLHLQATYPATDAGWFVQQLCVLCGLRLAQVVLQGFENQSVPTLSNFCRNRYIGTPITGLLRDLTNVYF